MRTTGRRSLIRPLIRANDNPKHKAHVVVFFIFIVSHAGGSLRRWGSSAGVPEGAWTSSGRFHIFPETCFLLGALLGIFMRWIGWCYLARGNAARVTHARYLGHRPRQAQLRLCWAWSLRWC